jgi:hypothetical protein
LRGKRGHFGKAETLKAEILKSRSSSEAGNLADWGDFGGKFIRHERCFPDRFAKIFLAAVF